ncbi:hypothetical protein C2G38_2196292 [Gigaspora rosea]|uniref:Uncharacterized protein n=1 Tax=Gigaspora rosea TaxID=44941 RepID=A0A397UUV0_9GLOM|nr:hypothetical protein C2G38_2196292 [Gigaspora rosea]
MDDTLRDLIEEIFLNKLKEHNDQLEKFKELVETTVDFEAAEHHHYVLKVDFNDELKVIKEKLDKTIREMNKEHQMVGRKLGLDTKKKLHFENKKLMDILATQRTGVFFTTRKLKELSSEFLSESEHYDDVQSSLVKEDINISDVSVRASTSYIRPKMMDKGEGHVILKNARHPCLEIQDDGSFIPIDDELIRGQNELQIITGPNMGGICDESFGIHVTELANFPEIAVKEGVIIIKQFLWDIAQTPEIESMNYNSILDHIQEVKGKYQEKIERNPWCREL